MLLNIFEPEPLIKAKLDTLIAPEMVLLFNDNHKVKMDLFRPYPEAERVCAIIQYEGFDIISKTANTTNQLLEVFYRVIIIAPVDSKDAAGTAFASMINLMAGAKLQPTWTELALIKDVREFNAVQYGESMIAIPALFSFKTPLRK